MTDHTYPDLVNVEDWLNAKGYTGEAGACHQAMSLIRSQEKRIAALEAALKPFADYSLAVDWEVFTPEMHFARSLKFPCGITYGDLRAARAALEKKND